MFCDLPKRLFTLQNFYQSAVDDGHKSFWSERFDTGLPSVEELTLFVIGRNMTLVTESDEVPWSVTSIFLPKAYVMDLEYLF